ncbi:unnamed protein product [Leptosia nina]|uniref:Uncharacterized protein n=1 Tax=Leptosia nina TaxID=320188 RepID=A0AAV1JKJ1_9NEOP
MSSPSNHSEDLKNDVQLGRHEDIMKEFRQLKLLFQDFILQTTTPIRTECKCKCSCPELNDIRNVIKEELRALRCAVYSDETPTELVTPYSAAFNSNTNNTAAKKSVGCIKNVSSHSSSSFASSSENTTTKTGNQKQQSRVNKPIKTAVSVSLNNTRGEDALNEVPSAQEPVLSSVSSAATKTGRTSAVLSESPFVLGNGSQINGIGRKEAVGSPAKPKKLKQRQKQFSSVQIGLQ